jgi:5'-3' exonuclease
MHAICKKYGGDNFMMHWVFDGGRSQARLDMHPGYKEGRGEIDGLFSTQVLWAMQGIETLGASIIKHAGTEADDIISVLLGYLAPPHLIVSSDKDFWQLVSEDVSVLNPINGEITTKESLEADLGGQPIEKYLMVKSICGDPSDNIQGIKGVGWSSALKAIKSLDSFDQLPHHDLTGRLSILNDGESIAKLKRNHALMSLPSEVSEVHIDNTALLEEHICDSIANMSSNHADFFAWAKASHMNSILKKSDEWNRVYFGE